MFQRKAHKIALTGLQIVTTVLLISGCSESGAESNPAVIPASMQQNPAQNNTTPAQQNSVQNNPTNGSTFGPNSTFSSASVGISLTMPNDITGRFDDNSGILGYGNPSNTVGGQVFGGTSGGLAAGEGRVVHSILNQLGLTIQQVFSENAIQGESISTIFHVKNNNDADILMQMEGRSGSGGNYVIVLGNSTFDNELALSNFTTQVANSVVFTNPQTPALPLNLLGTSMEFETSNTTFFEGTGSLSGGTKSALIICNDGRYAFSSESTSIASFDDVSGGGTDTIQHGGLFATHADFSNNQLIELRSQTQGTFVFNATALNGMIFIDTDGYTQTSTTQAAECG